MLYRILLVPVTLSMVLLSTVPLAEAQPAGTVYRIGVIFPGPLPLRMHQWNAFRQRLRELGYTEGQNAILEFRAPADENAPLDDLVTDLVRRNVDVIVTVGIHAVRAVKRETSTIPIVMSGVADPVAAGVVASLARPGGNITGIYMMAEDVSAKRLQLLREVVPNVSLVTVLWDRRVGAAQVQAVETAARAMGIHLLSLEASQADELEKAFQAASKGRAEALVVTGSALYFGLRAKVADLALKHRLTTIYPLPSFVDAGGLMAYGPSETEFHRQAAVLVDKILKGAKPGDLPIEQSSRFEFAINMRTARALRLTIPSSLVIRADRLIE